MPDGCLAATLTSHFSRSTRASAGHGNAQWEQWLDIAAEKKLRSPACAASIG